MLSGIVLTMTIWKDTLIHIELFIRFNLFGLFVVCIFVYSVRKC